MSVTMTVQYRTVMVTLFQSLAVDVEIRLEAMRQQDHKTRRSGAASDLNDGCVVACTCNLHDAVPAMRSRNDERRAEEPTEPDPPAAPLHDDIVTVSHAETASTTPYLDLLDPILGNLHS